MRLRSIRLGLALLAALLVPSLAAAQALFLTLTPIPLVAWSAQDAINGPFHVNALEQRAYVDADFSRPRRYRLCSTVECQQALDVRGDERLHQGTLNRPAQIKPPIQRSDRYTAMPSRPFSNSHPATAKRQESVVAFVPSLFQASGPAAIIRRVRTVVVDPLNRVKWRRTRPHIGQERIKRLRPLVADRDSSPAVILVGRTCWVQDAHFHFEPDTALATVGLLHV